MQVLCIFRAACFSPGMVERDEAILRAVADRLRTAHYAVSMLHEEDFTFHTPMPDIVLHMARSPRSLEILKCWQASGCRVLNSADAVSGVEREALALRCAALRIPTPTTWIVSTESPIIELLKTTEGVLAPMAFPCWVKRTGACAQCPDDVCFVSDAVEYGRCLASFRTRSIDKVVVMEHLEGAAVKFYGVRGTGFFCVVPFDKLGYDKFSRVSLVEEAYGDELNLDDLEKQLQLTGFHLDVYGGDVIVDADGVARLIDLNDWPSFSVCREEAAEAIARLVLGE